MLGVVAHWFQTYKQLSGFQQWDGFMLAVVAEFEIDTHRTKTMELLGLKQLGYVDEYRR
jgi:hypothetical protein